MKTKNFDDAVRNKLENIIPQYEEKDIDNVHDYVNRNRSKFSKRGFAYLTAASFAMIIIAGLVAWNIKQMKNQKQMVQTIADLKKNLAEAQTKPAIVKSDTVFVKEYIHDAPVNDYSLAKQPVNPNIINGIAEIDDASVNKVDNGIINHQERNASKQNSNTNQVVDNPINVQKKVDNSNQTAIVKSNETTQEDSSIQKDSIIVISNALVANNAANTYDITKETVKEHHQLFSFLKNWHYMVGVEGLTGNRQIGYGAKGEILFNNKWGLNIGARFLTVNNQNYNDNDDFRNRVGQDFQAAYNPYITDTSSISNIRIRINILQIPVLITYRIPLIYNFECLFGIGADIDVLASQDIDYKHHKDVNTDELKSVQIKYHSLALNNAVFMAGIEKRWKHICFQMQSFISPQVKSVAYKKENLYYGLDLTAAYAFGK